jgi:hypothetical protein
MKTKGLGEGCQGPRPGITQKGTMAFNDSEPYRGVKQDGQTIPQKLFYRLKDFVYNIMSTAQLIILFWGSTDRSKFPQS